MTQNTEIPCIVISLNSWIIGLTVGIWYLTIQNPEIFEIQTFFPEFQMSWQNGSHLSGFQMVGVADFRSHLPRPFATQPLFDHLKTKLVRISDPHCNLILTRFSLCISGLAWTRWARFLHVLLPKAWMPRIHFPRIETWYFQLILWIVDTIYSGDPNTRLLQYLNGWKLVTNCPIFEW